ncbi:MAG: 50S ribosomal protein L29, partial [Alphaproteobacteria bacterium]|nr:50S ribosomal protein L29 [Alphaproteobacteria bacterium]
MAEKKTVKKTEKAAKVDNSALTAEMRESRLIELKKEAMNQRFQHAAGQLPKTHVIRKTRREIARVKT